MEQIKLDFTAIKEDIAKIKAVIMSLQFNDLPQGLRELLERPQVIDMAKLEAIEVEHSIYQIQRDIADIKEYIKVCHMANKIVAREEKFQWLKNKIRSFMDWIL